MEAYIAERGGYNLWHKATRKFAEDNNINAFSKEDIQKLYKEVNDYNYDFRHEYAIYKEYEQAMKDGKLEEYHRWFMDLREKQNKTGNINIKRIKNDTKIRESIYKKLKEGGAHVFLRNQE